MAIDPRNTDDSVWGTNGVPSLPQAIDNDQVRRVDMQGFCFTPYGLRVNLSEVDREELFLSAYRPPTAQTGGETYE